MNELPVIGSLFIREGFWDRRGANITSPCKKIYYMAKPVLGKPQPSDWFFLGRDFEVRTISVETVQAVYFCFGAKPANS